VTARACCGFESCERDGIGLATASGSQAHSYVLVSVDGSSLNIVDRAKNKGFGIVGNVNKSARGLKVVTSYALQPDGTPLGVWISNGGCAA
jgi:hypothetical protein